MQEVVGRFQRVVGLARFSIVNALAAVFGVTLWVYGSALTGRSNVFDAPLYPLYLFGGGVCFSALLKRHGWWSVAAAILVGQLVGYWRVVAGDTQAFLWPFGVAFLFMASVLALAGALVPPLYRALRHGRTTSKGSGPPDAVDRGTESRDTTPSAPPAP